MEFSWDDTIFSNLTSGPELESRLWEYNNIKSCVVEFIVYRILLDLKGLVTVPGWKYPSIDKK